MTAYEIPSLRFALEAGAAVAIRRFVKADSSGNGVQAGAGESAIGVSMNNPALGETLEIADGIVIVEASAAISANALVQSDANGKAVTLTTGIPLGVALTSSGGTGNFIAVKTPCAGAVGDVTVDESTKVISYQVEDLAAGVDITDRPIYVVPAGYSLEITAAQVVMQGASADVDDANTSVIVIEVGATGIASKTYNTGTQPPASGAAGSLGAIANGTRAAGDVLTFSITNGVTANLPALILQITGTLTAV